jgi:hypothetical protein
MSTHFRTCLAVLCGAALIAFSSGGANAERRVAMVVGNAQYQDRSMVLPNPKNDAEDVAAALRSIGFEVMEVINSDKRGLDRSMASFARMATDSDTALFYYAGHALQYQGRNYLMPVDAEVQDEISLRYQMLALDDVRAALDRTAGVKVMILDACRNNSVADLLRRNVSGASRAIGNMRGLARIDKTQGMVVAFSTAADDVAADGSGRNSPFTRAFLRRIKEPGLEIEKLFRRVASDVNEETGGRQRPETYVSLLSDYYLNQADRVAFESIKDTGDPAALKTFISKFPSSSFVADAQSRLEAVETAARERQRQQARADEAARILLQQQKAEREAAQRAEDEQQEKLVAAERDRAAREAAQRLQDEQREKIAVAERERVAREAAQRLQAEQREKAAAGERERIGREAAQRLQDEQRTRLADRQKPQDSPAAAGTPMAALEPAPQRPAAATSEQSCDRDRDRLARLRSRPSRDEIVAFERELSCDRLRPQLVRLRESLSPDDPASFSSTPGTLEPVQSKTAEKTGPVPQIDAAPAGPESQKRAEPKGAAVAAGAPDQAQTCKQDEARLSRLRAKPSRTAIIEFERDLGCEKLRPQIVRLRESLIPAGSAPTGDIENRDGGAKDQSLPRREVERPPATTPSASSAQSCDQERARLARLRDTRSREEVVRFEKALECEQLRPQVLRLRESLTGG